MTKEEQIANIRKNIAALSEEEAKEMLFESVMNNITVLEIVKQKTSELQQVKEAIKNTVNNKSAFLN